mmetsp:Transcript_33104/g.24356  ORF Transcript_33104/g.24356 Transcript_33104/m.24356 type:complete len:132 (-) Transcript_33104:13-408(-)
MAFADKSDAFTDGTGILMGLGFPSMAAYNFTPVFDHIMQLKLLPQNIFSFSLSLNPQTPSQLLFGKIDHSRYQGSLKYYPVRDQQFWTIGLEGVKIGDIDLGICSKEKPCYAAIDSGTSFLTFPMDKFQAA